MLVVTLVMLTCHLAASLRLFKHSVGRLLRAEASGARSSDTSGVYKTLRGTLCPAPWANAFHGLLTTMCKSCQPSKMNPATCYFLWIAGGRMAS